MEKLLLILVGASLIGACGGTGGADASAPDSVAQPAETVFDPMVGTMDRAKGVEDLSSSRKDEMDAAIDQTE